MLSQGQNPGLHQTHTSRGDDDYRTVYSMLQDIMEQDSFSMKTSDCSESFLPQNLKNKAQS